MENVNRGGKATHGGHPEAIRAGEADIVAAACSPPGYCCPEFCSIASSGEGFGFSLQRATWVTSHLSSPKVIKVICLGFQKKKAR